MGISKPWPEAMNVVTGQRKFDGAAIVEYFRPLTEWLAEQNRKNGDQPGWPDRDWIPPLPPGKTHIMLSIVISLAPINGISKMGLIS